MIFSTVPAVSADFEKATEAFNAKYKRRILLCLLGETPAVITETLSLLLKEGVKTAGQLHAFRPTELRIITTGDGAAKLNSSDFENWLNSCLEAWGYTKEDKLEVRLHLIRLTAGDSSDRLMPRELAKSTLYTMTDVNFIGDSRSQPAVAAATSGMDRKQIKPESLGDVRNSQETQSTADYLLEQIDELVKDKCAAIHASIAGGRKSMGALLTQIMSLLGREQDGISHVLPHKKLEPNYGKVEDQQEKEKWTKLQPWLKPSEKNELGGLQDNKIFELSTVDFVRLSPVHQSPRLAGETYSKLVERINARLHGRISFSPMLGKTPICETVNIEDLPLKLRSASRGLLLWLVCQTGMKYQSNSKTNIVKIHASINEALTICGRNKSDFVNNSKIEVKNLWENLNTKAAQLQAELVVAGFPHLLKIRLTGRIKKNEIITWNMPGISVSSKDAARFDLTNITEAVRKKIQLS